MGNIYAKSDFGRIIAYSYEQNVMDKLLIISVVG